MDFNSVMKDSNGVILVKEPIEYTGELKNANEIVSMMNSVFKANQLVDEYVWLLCLDTRLKANAIFRIGQGGLDYAPIDKRVIFRNALLCNSAKIILIHNHPSGDPTPSKADDLTTSEVRNAGSLLNCPLIDHIIIGNEYYSYAENNFKGVS